ncbi:M23 family metallopeptidase [Candidatus Beckwithbacteria bacterium]|nr:M23 family metallopeptidase [Candidatus Beckwithbacteria bacterium]
MSLMISNLFYPIELFFKDLNKFFLSLFTYLYYRLFASFTRFEKAKGLMVNGLTAKRGKYVRPFLHTSMIGLFLIGLAVTPLISDAISQDYNQVNDGLGGAILGESVIAQANSINTQISDKPESTVKTYVVKDGATLSTIAEKFGVSVDTIRWQNNLKSVDEIKEADKLEIPPVTGIVHKVKRGDTIYSIAKDYSVDAQAIVNWPYNTYTDDENFGLAVGQLIIIPDGIKPKEQLWDPNAYLAQGRNTPNAGAVSALGSFVWPTSGVITQYFRWYHQGLDIANRDAPDILAADSGTVVVAGWPDNWGYGNRVIIDHGNGFVTLYAHMQAIYVFAGQTVNRGDALGRMGSTGRSTGTHLHFEIRANGVNQDPLSYLQ